MWRLSARLRRRCSWQTTRQDLVTLARGEKDVEMKQYLVQQLSLMHNQEATKYMLEILNK